MTLLRESDLDDNKKLVAESINQLDVFANPAPVPSNPLTKIVPYQEIDVEYYFQPGSRRTPSRHFFHLAYPVGGKPLPRTGLAWFWYEWQSHPSTIGRESYITRVTGYDVIACGMLHERGPIDETLRNGRYPLYLDSNDYCSLTISGYWNTVDYMSSPIGQDSLTQRKRVIVGVRANGHLAFSKTPDSETTSYRIGVWHLGGE